MINLLNYQVGKYPLCVSNTFNVTKLHINDDLHIFLIGITFLQLLYFHYNLVYISIFKLYTNPFMFILT